MFGLDTQSLGSPRVDMDNIREWAGEITNSYLSSGVEPTHTLKKIAQAEDLTPDQVQVLAAEANKSIHNHKYASIDEKYHAADFPLADAARALEELQLDSGETKVAAHFPEPKMPGHEFDPYQAFGVQPEEIDKTASVRNDLKIADTKSDLLLQKLNDKVLTLQYQKEAAERNFIKEARQYLLDESSSNDRMRVIGVLDHLVKESGQESGKKALAKLAVLLQKEGKLEPSHAKEASSYLMEKKADNTAPSSMISDHLQARIINGQHPLYISLKTIGDREADLLRYEQQRDLVQDKARILKQKIRAL